MCLLYTETIFYHVLSARQAGLGNNLHGSQLAIIIKIRFYNRREGIFLHIFLSNNILNIVFKVKYVRLRAANVKNFLRDSLLRR